MAGRRALTEKWGVAALFGLALFLRFWRLAAQSLWDDEVATFRAAALSLRQIWTDIPLIDSNPPLIYTVLHFWRALGESEFTLRSLPALLGAIAVPVAYLALRRPLGRAAAGLAAFWLAVNPLAVYCGQETRYNTLVTLLVLLAVWALTATLAAPRRATALGLAVAASLAMYSHYFSFFPLAALALFLGLSAARLRRCEGRNATAETRLVWLAYYSRSAVTRWEALAARAAYREAIGRQWRGLALAAGALVAAALSFAPFLKFFTIQLLRGVHWRESLGTAEVLERAAVWTFVGHSVTAPPTFFAAWNPWFALHPARHLALLFAAVLPAIALALYGMTARRDGARPLALPVLALAPVAGVTALSRLTPIFDPRYLLPLVPFWLAASAAGMVELWRRRRRVLPVVAALWLLSLTALSLKDYYYSPAHWRQDWRGLAARVAREAEPDAAVLFYNFYTSLAFLHYYEKAPARPPVQYLYVLEERFGPLDDRRRRVAQVLDGVARESRPVWLIDYHGYMDDPYDDVRQGLRARQYALLLRECRLPGLWRYCLERWVFGESRRLAALADDFDFETRPPVDCQLAAGWYPGEGRRWMGERAELLFRRPAGRARLRLQFFVNQDYLRGPLTLRVAAAGQPIGEVTVTDTRDVVWTSPPFAAPPGDEPTIRLSLAVDRVFVPDDVRHDGDRAAKSILVKAAALEAADE
ncbi:MAG: hypothetical protein GX444_19095 [Myxococcales bacterium]|nr:hypothetical protein [Myxococcales bacterium]